MQMPNYYALPITNMEKLSELVTISNDYGFLHDDNYSMIDLLMSMIHGSENTDSSDPESVWDLFEIADNKEQFIQDYRNVIGAVFSGEYVKYDGSEFVDWIIGMRDPEMYKLFTRPR
jgi:hypothetical protein